MDYIRENLRALLGIVGTALIAGWVAFSVSASRNVDNGMNQPMAQLGGSSINESVKETQASIRADQCERFTVMAQDAWDRAVDQGTLERDADTIAEYDRQRDQFCS